MLMVNQLIGFGVAPDNRVISFVSQAGNDTNASSYTFTAQDIGPADSTRRVIVGVHARRSTAANVDVTAVTVQGISATSVASHSYGSSSRNELHFYIVAVPTGTTGDIVVTMSGTCFHASIFVFSATGWSSGPTLETSGGAGASSSTTETATTSGNVSAGAYLVGIGSGLLSFTITGDVSKVGTDQDNDTVDSVAALGGPVATGGATKSMTVTGASNDTGALICAFI